MKVAILDLGTNVFNLLIAQVSKDKCEIKEVVKRPSFIGSGGFATGYLSKEAMDASMESMGEVVKDIEKAGGVDVVKAFATSAVRDAKNGRRFTDIIRERYGIEVETIKGDREAELIYKGVRESALFYKNEKMLICDIGGGSVEMIIADKEKIYWKESFDLGVVRLMEIFKPDDPITPSQIGKIESYLEKSLENLWSEFNIHKPKLMIGTSGSFDTLRALLCTDDDGTLTAINLELSGLKVLHKKLLASTRAERLKMPRMSLLRVDYMVIGSIFVQLVIEKCNIAELCQSDYSLKEGYMAEIAENMKNCKI